MIDDSYAAALERAPVRDVVLIGPVQCKGCGAWVEWAGVDWLALGTTERHDCSPYLAWHAHLRAAFGALGDTRQEDAFRPYPRRVRPTTGLMQAHQLGSLPPTTAPQRRAMYVGLVLLALALAVIVTLWPAP